MGTLKRQHTYFRSERTLLQSQDSLDWTWKVFRNGTVLKVYPDHDGVLLSFLDPTLVEGCGWASSTEECWLLEISKSWQKCQGLVLMEREPSVFVRVGYFKAKRKPSDPNFALDCSGKEDWQRTTFTLV